MNDERIKIKKRGDDGHRIISIRLPLELIEKLDRIAGESNYSRNQIMVMLLEHGVDNVEIED